MIYLPSPEASIRLAPIPQSGELGAQAVQIRTFRRGGKHCPDSKGNYTLIGQLLGRL
jgi:hypothetical protein